MFKNLVSKIKKVDTGVIQLLISLVVLVLVVLIYTKENKKEGFPSSSRQKQVLDKKQKGRTKTK